MIGPDTTRCDACGRRYTFNHYKDRCPVCCPDQKRDDDVFEEWEVSDEIYDDDD